MMVRPSVRSLSRARRRRLRYICSVVPRLAAVTSSSKGDRRGDQVPHNAITNLVIWSSGHLVIWSLAGIVASINDQMTR